MHTPASQTPPPACTVVLVSKLTDRLKEAKSDRSIDDIAALAVQHGHHLSRGTVAKYLRDEQGPRPPVKTLDALAAGFRIDPREVRELAGYTPGELGPWSPPDESASLTRDQRDALDRLIKSMVRVEGGSSDGGQPDAQKSPRGGGVTSIDDRRRQNLIDQGQPVEEAADDHPFDLPPDDEDGSQDPEDWGED